MAVVAVWQCDRDGKMFENKKDAEEYDKMLELAENISAFIQQTLPDISDQHSESVGLILAQHRETLAKACKGKPEALLEIEHSTSEESDKGDADATAPAKLSSVAS